MSQVQLRSSSPVSCRSQNSLAANECNPLVANECNPLVAPSRFNPPLHDTGRKSGDLRIMVPSRDSEAMTGLAEAIVMEPTSLSSLISPYNFDKITQLPTPVVSNGSFPNYQLEIQKRGPNGVGATSGVHGSSGPFPPPSRVFSEFDPGRLSKSPLESIGLPVIPKSRHISNPALICKPGSLMDISLSQLDAELSLEGLIYRAPNLEVSYLFDQVIGSGTFSTVVSAHAMNDVEAKDNETNVVAVKIVTVPTDDVSSVSNFRLYIRRELGIMMHLHHPSIVQLLDYHITLSITPDEIDHSFTEASLATPAGADMYDLYNMKMSNKQYFFLSFCRGGNLLQWLLQNHKFAISSVAFWKLMERIVAELICAVAFLHANMVVHRDIKLENILLNKTFELGAHDTTDIGDTPSPVSTLTDFGLSKKLELSTQLLSTKCGSQDYVSPELLMGLKYDGKLLDSWSLGVVIYSILEDRLPFDLPKQEFTNTQGVSPSVLKRRRSKHSPAHRIAMIDWDWFRVPVVIKGTSLPQEAKDIMSRLMAVVEVFLARKDKRMLVSQVLDDVRFAWIKAKLPGEFYDFERRASH